MNIVHIVCFGIVLMVLAQFSINVFINMDFLITMTMSITSTQNFQLLFTQIKEFRFIFVLNVILHIHYI